MTDRFHVKADWRAIYLICKADDSSYFLFRKLINYQLNKTWHRESFILSWRLCSPSPPLLLTKRGEPTFYRYDVFLTTLWIIDGIGFADQTKKLLVLQHTEIPCSQSRLHCLFWRSKTVGLKTEGEIDCLLNPPSFLCFSLCLDGIFLDPTEIPVWQLVQYMVGGFRLDVWQYGTRQRRYLRNAFSSSPLWGRLRGKSAKASRLATLQKSARAPLPLGACNSKLGKALFSSF